MSKHILFAVVISLLGLTMSVKLCGQNTAAEPGSQQNAVNNALHLFYASIGDQSSLYNGPEYNGYDPKINGTAYFSDVSTFTSGTVDYDGAVYRGVFMLYDLYADKIAVLLYNHFTQFSLVPEKVKSFDFLGHHFIYLNADSITNNPGIKSGYYDQLYAVKTMVLVRREKEIQTNTGGIMNSPQSYFESKVAYFVRKNNAFYSFSGQGGLLDIFKDRKKELQQYIRINKLKFRQDPEGVMVKITSYYDQLTK